MSTDSRSDLRGISDIARVREIDRRLRSAEVVGYAGLAVPVVLGTFWVGVWPIGLIAAEALVALILRRAIATLPGSTTRRSSPNCCWPRGSCSPEGSPVRRSSG